MLAMRMQRNGRKGKAFFRLIVQESRLSPKSGRVVAYVGTYDPHSKAVELDNEKISQYLSNGTQPSDAVARLLRSQKVELPKWVKLEDTQSRSVRNPEKLRKNQPAQAEEPAKPETNEAEAKPEAESSTESATTDAGATDDGKKPADEVKAADKKDDKKSTKSDKADAEK